LTVTWHSLSAFCVQNWSSVIGAAAPPPPQPAAQEANAKQVKLPVNAHEPSDIRILVIISPEG